MAVASKGSHCDWPSTSKSCFSSSLRTAAEQVQKYEAALHLVNTGDSAKAEAALKQLLQSTLLADMSRSGKGVWTPSGPFCWPSPPLLLTFTWGQHQTICGQHGLCYCSTPPNVKRPDTPSVSARQQQHKPTCFGLCMVVLILDQTLQCDLSQPGSP